MAYLQKHVAFCNDTHKWYEYISFSMNEIEPIEPIATPLKFHNPPLI